MSSAVPSPTAARKTSPPAPGAATRPAARPVRRRSTPRHELARGRTGRARLTARAAALGVIALLLLTLAVAPLRTLIDQRNHLAELERRSTQLEDRNADLEARVERFNDPAYLERLARACLGMVRPGETAFVIVPTRGTPATPPC